MKFALVDIKESSKCVKFIFCNDDTIQLSVTAHDTSLFKPYHIYDIQVSHSMIVSSRVPFHNETQVDGVNTLVGVVTRKTRNSISIAAGNTQWLFPRRVCSLNPGMDVCITTVELSDKTS